MSYTPRTSRTSPTIMLWNGSITSTNKYWYDYSINGGATNSLCIPNCTTYSRGRLAEILGYAEKIWNDRSATGFPDATNWHYNNLTNGWTLGSTNYSPKPGDVACWSGGAGHVAIVEAVIDGVIYVSESRYRNATHGSRSFTNPGDEGGDVYFRYGPIKTYSGLTFEGYLINPHTEGPGPGPEPEFKTWLYTTIYSKIKERKNKKHVIY